MQHGESVSRAEELSLNLSCLFSQSFPYPDNILSFLKTYETLLYGVKEA